MIRFVLLAHAAGLALSIWTIVRSGDRTQVLLYAFILDYLFRLATVYLRSRRAPALAPYLSSLPPKGVPPAPLRYEDSNVAVGWAGYVLVTAALAAFATLTAAAVVVFRQTHDLGSSGWVLLGPLLAFRTIFDVNAARRLTRGRQ